MLRRPARVALALTLALWFAALASAAIAAMNVFGYTDDVALTMPRFAAYPVEHHPRLLAGGIMEGVFFVIDMLQFAAAPLALALLLFEHVALRLAPRRLSLVLRGGAIVAASAVFAWHGLVIAPGMNRELRAYWDAAEAGDLEVAETHRAAFEAEHPGAERRLEITLVLVLVALGANAVAPLEPRGAIDGAAAR